MFASKSNNRHRSQKQANKLYASVDLLNGTRSTRPSRLNDSTTIVESGMVRLRGILHRRQHYAKELISKCPGTSLANFKFRLTFNDHFLYFTASSNSSTPDVLPSKPSLSSIFAEILRQIRPLTRAASTYRHTTTIPSRHSKVKL